ncbi:hypothetical protein NDU88_005641 [Pleurodeles waltl]|uniref:Uncharacterized protein n=1 Tax=Pleurodeles waltl TaxID=8319 RepID=A0AAV7MX18_PLEWA|nr:hypothetical protein NDU88_005641 [Pleurodeles waltl]
MRPPTPPPTFQKEIMSIAGQFRQSQRLDPTLKNAWHLALSPDDPSAWHCRHGLRCVAGFTGEKMSAALEIRRKTAMQNMLGRVMEKFSLEVTESREPNHRSLPTHGIRGFRLCVASGLTLDHVIDFEWAGSGPAAAEYETLIGYDRR